MKNKNVLTSLLLLLFISTAAFAQTSKQTNDWYNKKEWLNGLQKQPHSSINKTEFAKQYQRNKEYWDKAFCIFKEP